MEEAFDNLTLSLQETTLTTTRPRQRKKQRREQEPEGDDSNQREEGEPAMPFMPPPMVMYKKAKLDPIQIPFIPIDEYQLKTIQLLDDKYEHDLAGNYRILRDGLVRDYEFGSHNYEYEVALKQQREYIELTTGEIDPHRQRDDEIDSDYRLRRNRYWEEIDSTWCFYCTHEQTREQKELFKSFSQVQQSYVKKNYSKTKKTELVDKLHRAYIHVFRIQWRVDDMFIDPYTNEPRPRPFQSKSQLEEHLTPGAHINDIPIAKEERLKKWYRALDGIFDEMKETSSDGDTRMNYTAIKTGLLVDDKISKLEKEVLDLRANIT